MGKGDSLGGSNGSSRRLSDSRAKLGDPASVDIAREIHHAQATALQTSPCHPESGYLNSRRLSALQTVGQLGLRKAGIGLALAD